MDRSHLWKGAPFKPLTVGLRKTGGRANNGRISVWHKGGGAKRLYRIIDFSRKAGVESRIERIEYDPNRSARIALVRHSGPQWNGGAFSACFLHCWAFPPCRCTKEEARSRHGRWLPACCSPLHKTPFPASIKWQGWPKPSSCSEPR